jgi:hypothetical protein
MSGELSLGREGTATCTPFIAAVAQRIDARQFNPAFPRTFPRFVQHAIWRYCGQSGLDVCNGNRINGAKRCGNMDCRVRPMCDRVVLRNAWGSRPRAEDATKAYGPLWQAWSFVRYRRAGTLAAKDVPNAGAHVLDAGHFALDTKAGEISVMLREFLKGTEVNEREKS